MEGQPLKLEPWQPLAGRDDRTLTPVPRTSSNAATPHYPASPAAPTTESPPVPRHRQYRKLRERPHRRQPDPPSLRPTLRRSGRPGCPRPRPTESSRRQRRRDQPPARPPKLYGRKGAGITWAGGIPHRKRHADTPPSIRGKTFVRERGVCDLVGVRLAGGLTRPEMGNVASRCCEWLPADAFRPNPRLLSGLHRGAGPCREGMRQCGRNTARVEPAASVWGRFQRGVPTAQRRSRRVCAARCAARSVRRRGYGRGGVNRSGSAARRCGRRYGRPHLDVPIYADVMGA